MSVTIAPVNVSAITKALEATLKRFPALEGATVERSSDPDNSPNAASYVGIYRTGATYPVRALGYGGGFRDGRVRLLVLMRASDQGSGEACEEALEELAQNVLSAILSNPTLDGVVGMLDEFEVDYTRYDRDDTRFMQTAVLQFVAIAPTTVS